MFTIVPVPVLSDPGSLGVSDETVLLLPAPEVDQPTSVQLALCPRLLPGHLDLGEQIPVAFLAVEVLPGRDRGTEHQRDQAAQDKDGQHF